MRASIALPSVPTGWVIFAHEGGSSRHGSALASVARSLNEAGLATLSMELLSPAESTRLDKLGAEAMSERLLAGAEWLRGEAGGLLGVVGAGEGASAALWAASEQGSGIASVVACAPQLEAAADRLGEVDAHTLLIVGGADRRALRQARWARRRLAHSEMVVVPGATRLFDAPAALRVLSERSVDWFQKTLVGDDRAEEVACERMSRESKRRLAAVASVFLMTGWALAPKVYPVVTAAFTGATGLLDIAMDADGDQMTVAGSSGGNVSIRSNAGDVVITGGPVLASAVVSIRVSGALGGTVNPTTSVPVGAQLADLSGVTTANGFTGPPTVIAGFGNGNDTFYGSAFYDNVWGGSQNDLLVGNDGDDYLRGVNNNDTVVGGAGNDTLDGGTGNDQIFGEAGDNRLTGAGGVDSLYGSDGNDVLDLGGGDATGVSLELAVAGAGNDTINSSDENSTADGGDGIDLIIREGVNAWEILPANAGAVYTVTPGAVAGSGTLWLSSRATPVTTYAGTFSNCEIIGMAGGGELVDSGLTNDSCDDLLDASGWNGTLGVSITDGNSGNDTLIGTGFNDTFLISNGSDSVVAGAGTDFLYLDADASNGGNATTRPQVAITPTISSAGNGNIGYSFYWTIGNSTWTDTISDIEMFQLDGGSFNDAVNSLLLGDTLDITSVNLTVPASVNGNNGRDSIVGSANADELNGNAQNDTVTGNDGNDTVNGGNDNDVVDGGNGDDSVTGGQGDDNLIGGAGDDLLRSDRGWDTMDGGAGTGDLVNIGETNVRQAIDTANGQGVLISMLASGSIAVRMAEVTNGTAGALATVPVSNVERYTFTGNDYNNTAFATSGDTLDGAAATVGISIAGNAGNDIVTGGSGNDTLGGGDQADTITGNDGNDSLTGGESGDVMNGGAGDDTLRSDRGWDTLDGGDGVLDQLNIGETNVRQAIDTANGQGVLISMLASGSIAGTNLEQFVFIGNNYNDTAFATGGDTLDGAADTLGISIDGNNGNDLITGGTGGDTLNGNAQSDTIEGNDGADILAGGNQNDHLAGGAGDDQYVGLAGTDTVSDAGGVDTVNLSSVTAAVVVKVGSLAISDTVGNKIVGEGVDDVIGTTLDDLFQVTLGGGSTLATNLYLDGNAGNDTLVYDPTGLDGVATVGTLAAGTISATGKPDVDFVNMEDLALRAVVSGARTWQEFE
ncbi:MAG: calcium-binding protein [Candidatus Sumerlaeota bacterium]|nr:calcium-binding protein [Candidatus Sumerlaeota bacterium]